MIRIGLAGIGFMGLTHYNIHTANRKVKLAAIADYNQAKLDGDWSSIGGNLGDGKGGNRDMSGIKTYLDYRDMLADPELDMIDICMPTDMHAEVAIAALKAGKHVFLEKPMARTAKQAKAIADAAAKAKGYFMVGHCIRFWPEYEVAYEMIRSKKYGKVREVFLRRVANPPTYADKNWFMNGKRSGGAALDLHIHDVDFALYLCGTPSQVKAWGEKGPSKDIDIVHASYEYKNGAHVNIIGGWAYNAPFPFNMEFCIRCDKATFSYDMAAGKSLCVYTGGKEINPKMPAGSGWSRELDYFIKCIETKKKPQIITATTSMESVKMVETEIKSIQTGKAIVMKK
jgi:predicted dehydrogenase